MPAIATILPVGFAIDRLEGDGIKKCRACTPLEEALALARLQQKSNYSTWSCSIAITFLLSAVLAI